MIFCFFKSLKIDPFETAIVDRETQFAAEVCAPSGENGAQVQNE